MQGTERTGVRSLAELVQDHALDEARADGQLMDAITQQQLEEFLDKKGVKNTELEEYATKAFLAAVANMPR